MPDADMPIIDDHVRRLTLTGVAARQLADHLQSVREALPGAVGDRVAQLAEEVEVTARTLAGECAMQLHELAA